MPLDGWMLSFVSSQSYVPTRFPTFTDLTDKKRHHIQIGVLKFKRRMYGTKMKVFLHLLVGLNTEGGLGLQIIT